MSPLFDEQFLAFQSALAGRYSLERELGRGGMGIVYLAREVRLDRPVAIKLLPPSAHAAGLKERFLREARTAAKLSHPHVIPIYAVEEIDPFVFFAMAYVEGKTLGARVRQQGPLPPSEAARMLREVAWALAYAHEQGIIHRDVKPDNILLEDATGRALVADFGIAGLVRDAATLDGSEVIGTPEFMSPEQALGDMIDHRSDLYSLGAVAFFALSGRLPFEGPTSTAVLAKQVSPAAAPPLTAVAPGVPRRLAQIVDQCLAKDRQQRPQSAGRLGEQLSRNLEQRKDLPVALRAFVKHDGRLDGPGVLVYPFIVQPLSLIPAAYFGALAGFLSFGTLMAVVPSAILIGRARRLLKSGFEHVDLDVAFKTEIERGREERAFTAGHKPAVLERLFRLGAITSFTAGAGSLAVAILAPGYDAAWFSAAGTFLSVGLFTGLGNLIMLQRRRDVDSEFWGKLWTGRIGRWLFGIARTFLPRGTHTSAMTHRPTELVIAMAADQLFADLPKDTRKGLAELPDVVARLEADARRMRARLEEIQDTDLDGPIPTGPGDAGRVITALRRERDQIQNRLADTVAALETIRLSLLHLHAGKISVGSLTTDLSRAREIAADVDRLMEGKREVEILLKKSTAERARTV
ncbi:MAG: serine/threonine protein kinase [Gemmatimonadetes bacterium]|nr:serine/threonine protein kinase [Gemmatimonadota bacterium]